MPHNTRVRTPSTSFIVRVWADDDSGSEMRGEVELVRTGERRLFTDSWSLLALIDSWRRDLKTAS